MDNVLVDFQSGIACLSKETKREYKGYLGANEVEPRPNGEFTITKE